MGVMLRKDRMMMKSTKARILIAALLLALVASIVPMGAAPMASSGDVRCV